MKNKIQKLKNDIKSKLPWFTAGAATGLLIGMKIIESKYNTQDRISIQLPDSALELMREEERGLTFHTDNDEWFTLRYHPNN